MPDLRLADSQVKLDEHGDLVNPLDWTPEVAERLAQAAGIARLVARHWTAITAFREESARRGEAPSLERIAAVSAIPLADLHRLFAGRPRELIARLAGRRPVGSIPEPHSSADPSSSGDNS